MKNIKKLLKHKAGIKLDIGCGQNKQAGGYVGMDICPGKGVDIVHDAEVVPYPLPDECCHSIVISHLIEHMCPKKVMRVMNELWRIMKPEGHLFISMPYGGSQGFWQDPTHCFSDDTDVLTAKGWKPLKDVAVGEKVLVMDPKTQEVRESKCVKVIHEDFEGEMLHFLTKRMDLLVTGNHDLFFRSSGRSKKNFQLKRADSFIGISKSSRVGVASIESWNGKRVRKISIPRVERGGNNAAVKLPVSFDACDFARFLGWYLSEGCVSISPGHQYRITIYQSRKENGKHYEEIRSLVGKMGFSTQCRDEDISFSSKDLALYLLQFGKDCYSKRIPEVVKSMSKDILSVLLDSLIKGDGSKNGKSGGFTYASVSRQLANDVQEIAIKCGYRSTLNIERRGGSCVIRGKQFKQVDIYLVSICRPSPVHYCSPKPFRYNGKIACITVADCHVILVRRNGKAVWSGNCHAWNEATVYYFDPYPASLKGQKSPLFRPDVKPWKTLQNDWFAGGNIQIVLEKREEE